MKKYVLTIAFVILVVASLIIFNRHNSKNFESKEDTIEKSVKLLFDYLYPEIDYFSQSTFYTNGDISGYEFVLPGDEVVNAVRRIDYNNELSVCEDFVIFGMYVKNSYYDNDGNRVFTHSNYISSYAVNLDTKEIITERFEEEIGIWNYNEKYDEAISAGSK